MELVISLKDDLETQELGEHLSKVCKNGITIYLEGDLGAGKTTLSKGFIRARGYNGIVKSPTYTLVESYSFSDTTIYHFDLYRLMDVVMPNNQAPRNDANLERNYIAGRYGAIPYIKY